MLVLTRQVGEEIIIDGNIHVRIVAIIGQKVSLGISAPPEILVDRKEVYNRRAEFDVPIENESLPLDTVDDGVDPSLWPPIELGVGD